MLIVTSMVGRSWGAGAPSSGSGAGGLIIIGQPAKVLGTRLARQGLAIAVREGERYAFTGPNGIGKVLVMVTLLGLQFYADRSGGSIIAGVVEASLMGSGAAAAMGGM
jgi:Fe-S cluster assembly ATPase SufC